VADSFFWNQECFQRHPTGQIPPNKSGLKSTKHRSEWNQLDFIEHIHKLWSWQGILDIKEVICDGANKLDMAINKASGTWNEKTRHIASEWLLFLGKYKMHYKRVEILEENIYDRGEGRSSCLWLRPNRVNFRSIGGQICRIWFLAANITFKRTARSQLQNRNTWQVRNAEIIIWWRAPAVRNRT